MRSLLLALLLPLSALAQSHSGVITRIRIDSATNAPICAATAPAMPAAAWACLYANLPH